nr:hypothetical protein [Bacillota bacterium]
MTFSALDRALAVRYFFRGAERSCQTAGFPDRIRAFPRREFCKRNFRTVFADEKSSRVAGRIFPLASEHPPFLNGKGLPSKAVTGLKAYRWHPAAWVCLAGIVTQWTGIKIKVASPRI